MDESSPPLFLTLVQEGAHVSLGSLQINVRHRQMYANRTVSGKWWQPGDKRCANVTTAEALGLTEEPLRFPSFALVVVCLCFGFFRGLRGVLACRDEIPALDATMGVSPVTRGTHSYSWQAKTQRYEKHTASHVQSCAHTETHVKSRKTLWNRNCKD